MAIKKDKALELRQRIGWDVPTKQAARILYNENPLLFKDVEDARSVLRYIEGKQGPGNIPKDKTLITKMATRPYNPYKLPKSDENDYKPYILKAKRLAILSDVHVPYHSISALTATFERIEQEKPDAILLNGDFLDFHRLSRFQVDPKKRSTVEEIETANQMLDIISKLTEKVYFKYGNHDERYDNYIIQKAPELYGLPGLQLENLLRFPERDITCIKDRRIIKANKLNVIHGHEFGQSVFSPVNIARGLYLRGKVSAIQGHNHSVSEHTEPNMNGEITTTWSLGCLCELHPQYLPINKWSHGMAFVDLDANGKDFHLRNYRIFNGKFM